MAKIGTWSTTAANNNATPPDGWPEGQAPSTVNDCAREMMAQLKTHFVQAEWFDHNETSISVASATSFKIAGDVTARYAAHRRLKLIDTTTLYGTVVSSSFSSPDTTINVQTDSGSLASLSQVSVAILHATNQSIPHVAIKNIQHAVDSAADDAYSLSAAIAPATYYDGLRVSFEANTANTGAATINLNGLGAKSLRRPDGSTLSNDDIDANQLVDAVYCSTSDVFKMSSLIGGVSAVGGSNGEIQYNNSSALGGDAVTTDGTGDWTWPTGKTLNMTDSTIQRPRLLDWAETVNADATFTGTETIDYETGNVQNLTLTGDVSSLTISNWPASGQHGKLTLYLTQDGTGGHDVTWPGAIVWPGGFAPDTSQDGANETRAVVLTTFDAGTTIYGTTTGVFS